MDHQRRAEAEQRLALTYAGALARIGVAARVRRVDETQYERRRQTFDFDMIIGHWLTSASPGNEQRSRWGSDSADREATFNFAGVRNAAVDGLIETMLASKTRRQPSLRWSCSRVMQARILERSGMSWVHKRNASPVQAIRCCHSEGGDANAWIGARTRKTGSQCFKGRLGLERAAMVPPPCGGSLAARPTRTFGRAQRRSGSALDSIRSPNGGADR